MYAYTSALPWADATDLRIRCRLREFRPRPCLSNEHTQAHTIHKHMYVRVLVRNVRWQGKVREGFYGGAYLVYVNLLLLPGEVKETRLVLRGLHMVESSFCSTLQDPGKDTSKYVEDQEVNRCSNKFGHLDR